MNDLKQIPPASVRNTPPLLGVLTRVFAPARLRAGTVLEIASGSGYHASAFAAALPHLTWQPTDADKGARLSIAAYVSDAGLANLRPPLALDVRDAVWPLPAAEAIVCINMIHISPWAATVGLFQGAGRTLSRGQTLLTYGPYAIDGDFQAQSNVDFDQSLRTRNPEWGIRDVSEIEPLAKTSGLVLSERIAMPANNHALVFTMDSR